jgi:hypothetical protein
MRSTLRVRASAGGYSKQAAKDERRQRRGSGLRRVFVQRMPCSRHQHKLKAPLSTSARVNASQCESMQQVSLKAASIASG